jgi:hypothetical protein
VKEWFDTLLKAFSATPFPTFVVLLVGALGWMARKWVGAIEAGKNELIAMQKEQLAQALKLAPLLELIAPVLRDATDVLERVEVVVGRKGKPRNPVVPEAKP